MAKHRFLIDENILYHAVRGVDEHDNEDPTAAELLHLVVKNCHSIVADARLIERYYRHARSLQAVSVTATAPILFPVTSFLTGLLRNSSKAELDYTRPAPVPGEERFPSEDIHVVRAARHFGATLVTADHNLLDSVNAATDLGVKALSPSDAIRYAKEL